jgi:AcrR family transcriptional regulator
VIAVDVLERLVYTDYLGLYNCAKARELLEMGETHAVVERIGDALDRRIECTRVEGLAVPLEAMKDCFRANYHPPGNPNAFTLPIAPNCHHGIRRLTDKEQTSPFNDVQTGDIVYRRFRA